MPVVPNRLPSIDVLRDRFVYSPESGEVRWSAGRRRAGNLVGYVSHYGYLVVEVDRVVCMVHRVAWKLFYGDDPPKYVDHADGDKLNNRISNLRSASWVQNRANSKVASKSGFKGVYKPKIGRGWVAQLRAAGVCEYLGYYKTPEQAHAAYVKRAKEVFGVFANGGGKGDKILELE